MPLKALIMSTDYFEKLPFIKQKVFLRYENQLLVQHGLEVLKNIGMERWLAQTTLSHTGKAIVIEIYNLNQEI
jgi:hypothetical protein